MDMQNCGMNKPSKSQNDPNVNFGMYEQDREAKRQAQTSLPSKSKAETDRYLVKRMLEPEGTRFGVYRDGKIWEVGYITEKAAQEMADLMNRLRCAPPFDAQAEHEKDLEYESRVDYSSWETDGQKDE